MDKTYLCINLNEFHTNQNKDIDYGTKATIKFINAKNQATAESVIHNLYPNIAWFVIDKNYADNRIVPADVD
jgi:hypothetical protein